MTNSIIPTDAVFTHDDQVMTSSRKVAEVFGKQHQHVTQKIESLECSEHFLTSNFSLVPYEHNGNEYKAYEMTKDGFMFLVMGFTGKKAAQIKEAYINAFNMMAEMLTGTQKLEHMPLSLAHQKALRSIIAKRAKGNRRAFSLIYNILYEAFDVPRYQEIPDSQFSEAVAIASAVSLQAIEGELMEPTTTPEVDIDAAQVITLSARVARHRWHQLDQLSEELVRISQQIRDVRSNLYDPLFGTAGFIPKLTHGEGVTDNQVQSFIEMQNRCRAR